MSKSIDIDWHSHHGRAELQKIATQTRIKLLATYGEQRNWSEKVVKFFKQDLTLPTASASPFLFNLRCSVASQRKASQSVGELPHFIPNVNGVVQSASEEINRYALPNVKVFALFNLGFVFFDEQNRVFEDISSQFFPLLELHPDLDSVLTDTAKHNEATFIADWFFERNYAHWLLDTIPRLMDRVGKVVCHEPANLWQQQLLQQYDVSNIDIVSLQPNVCLTFSSLYLDGNNSKPVPHPAYKCNAEALRFIRKGLPKFIKECPVPREKNKVALVVHRFDSRILINSNQLEAVLLEAGYIVKLIDCSKLSVRCQIESFAQADLVVGVHGAALANFVFCKKGTHVIEIFPNNYGNPAFWAISNAVGANYTPVTEVIEQPSSKLPRYKDIRITDSGLKKLHQLIVNK
jgi:hypothetical protein